jgi:hypothetical protein
MRIQSTCKLDDRGLDAYFTPPEAINSLIAIEGHRLPRSIWEPAAGDGAIVRPLRDAGYRVVASDIVDYGLDGCRVGVDYLKAEPQNVGGVITNPPFRLAKKFAIKAVSEYNYVALLLRTNFLESMNRMAFFLEYPPSRIWVSSRRLPMMHRHGWDGNISTSNTAYAWFIWDGFYSAGPTVNWFDWMSFVDITDIRKQAESTT